MVRRNMSDALPSEMTNEIAYRLGKFDFPSFYGSVRLDIGQPVDLYNFFEWTKDSQGVSYGNLKTNTFNKEDSHKLNYVRGRLSSYSVSVTNTTIHIHYANSYDLRDFMARCINDVCINKFVLDPPTIDPKSGCKRRVFKNSKDCPKFEVWNKERVGTMPGTPYIEVIADKIVIDYITGRNETSSHI